MTAVATALSKLPVAAELGRGWHVRVGPVLVSNYQPCSISPRMEEATCTLSYGDGRPDVTFHGWAFRWPPFTIAASGRLGFLARAHGRRKARRRAERHRGPGVPMTAGGASE